MIREEDFQISDHKINFGPYVMWAKVPKELTDNLIAGGEVMNNDFRDKLAGHLKLEKAYNEAQRGWFAEQTQPLFNEYRKRHNIHHNLHHHYKEVYKKEMPPVKLNLDSLWINYMTRGEFNPPHTHSGDLSFVIYCQVPENMTTEFDGTKPNSAPPGSIVFQHGINERPSWTTTECYFEPKVGDMFIFPALMSHMVIPFRCEGTRISVSGNITYMNREEWEEKFF